MSFESYIAQRFLSSSDRLSLTRPFIRITIAAVVLSVSVMIVAIAVITGFKREIKQKVVGFGSHIQITNYDSNQSLETNPIPTNLPIMNKVKEINGVRHIQQFAIKAGIIKTDTDIQGVALKGVASDFDWSFFKKNLVEGSIFVPTDSLATNATLISKTLAQMLRLRVGDSYDVFFVQEPPRYRRFTIAGIYDTKMVEFDKMFVLCDIKHIRKLNGWNDNQATGFEILVKDIDRVDDLWVEVDDVVGLTFLDDGSRLRVKSIIDIYPNIFDWLNLQDVNAAVLIVLMLLVAAINMISGLLIIILEKTSTVGLLKSLGATNRNIRFIFLIQSAIIMVRGLIWGTAIGLIICMLQKHFGLIKLDEAFYFLSEVPINVVWWHVLVLNIAAFAIGVVMLVVPSMVISRISPEKTLKVE